VILISVDDLPELEAIEPCGCITGPRDRGTRLSFPTFKKAGAPGRGSPTVYILHGAYIEYITGFFNS
jgi:hypothetical protein